MDTFHRFMGSGRNKAVLLSGAAADGRHVECIVKLACFLTTPPLEYLREWWACALGRFLGLHVPEAFEVRFDPQLQIKGASTAQSWAAYGSRYEQPAAQLPHGDLELELRHEAVSVLAFDVLIHNIDRRVDNPNVLVQHHALVPIDHDMGFDFLDEGMLVGAPALDPVLDPRLDILEKHRFGRSLKAKRGLSMDPFLDRLGELTDAEVDSVRAATPPDWEVGPAAGKGARIAEVTKGRRAGARTWLKAVEAWLG